MEMVAENPSIKMTGSSTGEIRQYSMSSDLVGAGCFNVRCEGASNKIIVRVSHVRRASNTARNLSKLERGSIRARFLSKLELESIRSEIDGKVLNLSARVFGVRLTTKSAVELERWGSQPILLPP